MKRPLVISAVLVCTLVACEGFKEAMTAHVDVAAKAGSQELSVDRLAALLSQAKVPVNAEVAKALTDLWVNYQLLGQAAARNDSLNDPKLVDEALWPIIAQARAGKWHDQIVKSRPGTDSLSTEAKYNQGDVLAARHILLLVPQGATPAQKDSIKKKAEALRAQVTSANFAEMAKKNSQDPGSAQRGGDLGVFPKGMMVPEFTKAVEDLKPGEISPVTETQFGYHIIRRSTYAEAKDEFAKAVNAEGNQKADSIYVADLEKGANVQFKSDAPAIIKGAAKDFSAHENDNTVIATSKAGEFTVAKMVRWVDMYPQKAELQQRLQQAPDSLALLFAKNIIRNELVLHAADSAKVTLDTTEVKELHNRFTQLVAASWEQLGITPKSLNDSAKTEAQRERLAASEVDQYIDRLMQQQARFVDVPRPLELVLHEKFGAKVNQAGLDRAVERATKLRAAADSTRAKERPPTEVPIGPAPQQAPATQAPAKKKAATDTSKKATP
jgi:peptidyl-prolyl cis-trans isomerase D